MLILSAADPVMPFFSYPTALPHSHSFLTRHAGTVRPSYIHPLFRIPATLPLSIPPGAVFSSMFPSGISVSAIVRDIRAAHKSDSESAPPTTIAEELKQDLEDVANFKGSPLEKQAALYCKRLGINYNKLSDVEFRQLVHILEKSKYFKSYVGQRKKRK